MASSSLFNFPTLNFRSNRRTAKRRALHKKAVSWHHSLTPRPLGGDAPKIESELNHKTIGLVTVGFVIMLVILWVQLWNLQLINGQRYRGLADGNRIRSGVTYAPRGRILDRNGEVLAQNTASFQLVVTPYLLPRNQHERQVLYAKIAQYSKLSVLGVTHRSEAHGLSYTQPLLIKENVNYQQALVIEQKLESLDGFSLDAVPVREYKADAALGNILGYVGRVNPEDLKQRQDLSAVDFIGRDGMEATYDRLLRGVNGLEQTEVDAMGRPVRVLAERPTQPGQDIVLSIDYQLQKRFAAAMRVQMKKAHVKRAAGVALDPRTGEVLSMVSLPSYDDNWFSRGISPVRYHKLISDPAQPLVNKAMSGSYPSGSIIKPMHLSGALQEGVVSPNTTIVDNGKLVIPSEFNPSVNYVFNGWNPNGLGPMNAIRAIAMSSDIYFYTVGGGYQAFRGMGVDRLTNYYQRFGLGHVTGIDLPGETAGLVPTPAWKKQTLGEDWFVGDTYHISIGQGDLRVSPLQMAVATAAVANGGKVLRPHVFEQTANGNEKAPVKVNSEIKVSAEHLKTVKEGMLAVIGGTTSISTFANVPVKVAGKSGTAENDIKGKKVPHAWYEAFAPYDNPQITFAVILENGFNGSAYAAPAIAQAMQWYFRDVHGPKPVYHQLGGVCSAGC